MGLHESTHAHLSTEVAGRFRTVRGYNLTPRRIRRVEAGGVGANVGAIVSSREEVAANRKGRCSGS